MGVRTWIEGWPVYCAVGCGQRVYGFPLNASRQSTSRITWKGR
jgi:hypothetical protein